MTQMDYLKIDPSMIQKHIDLQPSENYLSHSTMRFWLNYQTGGYSEHWHLDLEMIIPIKNDYAIKVGETTYQLSPGDIFIVPPGEPHELISRGDGLRFIFIMELWALQVQR